MKHQLSVLLCVFASMYFLISCKKETVAEQENDRVSIVGKKNESANKMNNAVPIKGSYVTTNQILHGPPFLQLRITGEGYSSHLGKGTFVAISTLNLTTPPPFRLSGTATFYAANGDAFYTTFTGTSTPIGGGISNVIVNHNITGGTGRFEEASGSFVGTAVTNPSLPAGSVTYEGYIIY